MRRACHVAEQVVDVATVDLAEPGPRRLAALRTGDGQVEIARVQPRQELDDLRRRHVRPEALADGLPDVLAVRIEGQTELTVMVACLAKRVFEKMNAGLSCP